jgi:hypothetical protein
VKGVNSVHWEIPMRTVVDGEAVASAIPAYIDSGTTLLIGPAAYVTAFYTALRTSVRNLGDGYWMYKVAPLNAGLTFGGETWPLDDDDLCRLRGDRAWWSANGIPVPEDGEWCLGALTGQGSLDNAGNVDTGTAPMGELDHWIVGNTFMKNVGGRAAELTPGVHRLPCGPARRRLRQAHA